MKSRSSPLPRTQGPAQRAPVAPPRSHAPVRPNQVQPFVRKLIWPVFILSIANGLFLYGLPWLAEEWYAWPIRPAISAGAMGAGYLIGVLGAGMGLFVVTRWRPIRPFIPAIFAVGVLMTIATLIHADRFRWGNPLTWLWIVVYVAIPIAAVLVWSLQERDVESKPAAANGLATIAGVSVAIGGVIGVTGVIGFVMPQSIMPLWPWPLTVLMTRALASWYVFMGVLLFVSGTTLRHVREIPIVHATVAGWAMLLLLLIPLHWSGARAGTGLMIWALCHALVFVFCALSALSSRERMRRSGVSF